MRKLSFIALAAILFTAQIQPPAPPTPPAPNISTIFLNQPPCSGVVGNGINDDTSAIQTCENLRPVGSTLVWPQLTYKITGQITAAKAGAWNMQGATLNITALSGALGANGQGGLTIPVSNFVINGGGSTVNFVPGTNAAAVFLSGGKYSRLGTDPIFQAYKTSAANIAVGATSFVATEGAPTLSPDDWVVVFHLDPGNAPGTLASNWIKSEFKQVVSVTGGTTVNVSVPFAQAFSNGAATVAAGAVTITNNGTSGCASGTYTVVGGTGTAATLTGVAAAGVITSLTQLTPGSYTVFPASPVALTGTGCAGSPTATLVSGCLGDETPAGTSCWPNLYVKLLNPIYNVGVNNLNINATQVVGSSVALDSDIGVINGLYQNLNINVSGLAYVGFFNQNFQLLNSVITHEDNRGSEISVMNGGRISGNKIWSQGTGNTTCMYLDDGVAFMNVDHNQCYGRFGGGTLTVQDSFHNKLDHNIIVCGATPGIGIFFFGGSGNTSDSDTILNCVEGVVVGGNLLQNGLDPANENVITNDIIRNATADSVRISSPLANKNVVIGLNTDTTDTAPVIVDAGTGTVLLNNNQGIWQTGPSFTVTGPDAATIFGVAGATKGIRFGANGTGATIQGIDNTFGTSFQPLTIGGGAATNFTGVLNLGAVSGAGVSAGKTLCVDASNNVLIKVGAC